MIDIDIPEVSGFAQQAKFFKKDGKDFVEISFIGNPDTVIQKVTPEIMARYRTAWDAYCDGVPMKQRDGTPLTTLKEVDADKAADLIRRNVHSLEELAALNDHQCQALGHGMITLRGLAQKLVALRAIQRRDDDVKKINSIATKPLPENQGEIDELRETVKTLSENMVAMMGAIQSLVKAQEPVPPTFKNAHPRKKKNGPKQHTGNNEPSV